jgi:competence protein ComEA
MSDVETRTLGRVALLLLGASVLRLGLASRQSPPPPPAADVLPALLAQSRARADEEAARATPLGAGERLDPNGATPAELDRLPGVGPATAEALVRSRELEGPFQRPEDLLRVHGVGPALLERIRPHLALAPAASAATRPPSAKAVPRRSAAPLDLNRADTLALQALPGVGPALARRIVASRSESRFRTVDDLLRVRGIGPATLSRLRPLVAVPP